MAAVNGFSQKMSLPASAAASMMAACVPGGVQMSTTSMSLRARHSSRQSVTHASMSQSAATLGDRVGIAPRHDDRR